MESHGIRFHQYADDTQLYTEIRSPVPSQIEALSQCVSALTFWFLDNGLQLNSTKSEAMILGSRQGLSRLEPVASLDIGDGHVEVRDEIKILGVHLDPTLSMNAQVKSLMKTSNFHIRTLRHVRRGLTFESAEMIALGLVTSRLDYCNSLHVWHFKSEHRQTPACPEREFKTIAQTLTLASSPAEDNIQDRSISSSTVYYTATNLHKQPLPQLPNRSC